MSRPCLGPGVLALWLLAPPLGAQPHEVGGERAAPAPFAGAEHLERGALIEAVLARNPGLEAARYSWYAARQKGVEASALADPTLSYAAAPFSVMDGEARFGTRIEVGQRIPYPGKRRLRGNRARAHAETGRGELETLSLELALEASLLFDDYYLVARALEINAEHVELLESFKRIATARYAAGVAPQQDPLQAEVELAHLEHRRVTLETRRQVAKARLNALLHRAPRAPLPPPAPQLPPPGEGPHAELLDAESESLQALALATRPELAAAAAEVAAAEAAVALARLERRPDFVAQSAYNSMWRIQEHRWTVGASVHLPIWRKRINANLAETEARLAAARSRRLRLADEIRAAVYVAHERMTEVHHVLTLYESRLLPAARDQVRAATAGFEASQSSFLALIEAEKSLRTIELAKHQALADYGRRAAELARTVGVLPQPASQTHGLPADGATP